MRGSITISSSQLMLVNAQDDACFESNVGHCCARFIGVLIIILNPFRFLLLRFENLVCGRACGHLGTCTHLFTAPPSDSTSTTPLIESCSIPQQVDIQPCHLVPLAFSPVCRHWNQIVSATHPRPVVDELAPESSSYDTPHGISALVHATRNFAILISGGRHLISE